MYVYCILSWLFYSYFYNLIRIRKLCSCSLQVESSNKITFFGEKLKFSKKPPKQNQVKPGIISLVISSSSLGFSWGKLFWNKNIAEIWMFIRAKIKTDVTKLSSNYDYTLAILIIVHTFIILFSLKNLCFEHIVNL